MCKAVATRAHLLDGIAERMKMRTCRMELQDGIAHLQEGHHESGSAGFGLAAADHVLRMSSVKLRTSCAGLRSVQLQTSCAELRSVLLWGSLIAGCMHH